MAWILREQFLHTVFWKMECLNALFRFIFAAYFATYNTIVQVGILDLEKKYNRLILHLFVVSSSKNMVFEALVPCKYTDFFPHVLMKYDYSNQIVSNVQCSDLKR